MKIPKNQLNKILSSFRLQCDMVYSEVKDGFYSQEDYEKTLEIIYTDTANLLDEYYAKVYRHEIEQAAKMDMIGDGLAEKIVSLLLGGIEYGDSRDDPKVRKEVEESAVRMVSKMYMEE